MFVMMTDYVLCRHVKCCALSEFGLLEYSLESTVCPRRACVDVIVYTRACLCVNCHVICVFTAFTVHSRCARVCCASSQPVLVTSASEIILFISVNLLVSRIVTKFSGKVAHGQRKNLALIR